MPTFARLGRSLYISDVLLRTEQHSPWKETQLTDKNNSVCVWKVILGRKSTCNRNQTGKGKGGRERIKEGCRVSGDIERFLVVGAAFLARRPRANISPRERL